MKANRVPSPTPQDLATERLAMAVESAIAGIEQRLPNLATDGQDAKWSVSDLTKLLQLRTQLEGQRPRTILACWVDDPYNFRITNNHNNQPEPNAQTKQ